MTGSVQLRNPEALRAFAREAAELRTLLTEFGRLAHTPVEPFPPGSDDLQPHQADLREKGEQAVDRFTQFVTDVDQGIAALASIAAYVAREYPVTDEFNGSALTALVQQAAEEVPRVPPDTTPSPDPRFVSPRRLN